VVPLLIGVQGLRGGLSGSCCLELLGAILLGVTVSFRAGNGRHVVQLLNGNTDQEGKLLAEFNVGHLVGPKELGQSFVEFLIIHEVGNGFFAVGRVKTIFQGAGRRS